MQFQLEALAQVCFKMKGKKKSSIPLAEGDGLVYFFCSEISRAPEVIYVEKITR